MAISPQKHIGVIYEISKSSLTVVLDDNITSFERVLNGKTYRIGQIGSFVVLPVGDINVIGVITKVKMEPRQNGNTHKEVELQLVGSVIEERFQKAKN